jgi:hypothetical protein
MVFLTCCEPRQLFQQMKSSGIVLEQNCKAVLQFIAIEGIVYYGVLHVSGLVLCLTGEKSDQYQRVGMIGHGRMRNYEAFLNCSIKPGEFGFRNFDPNFGHIIEIV